MSTNQRVIALGFFDGVHTAHGALLRRVKEAAAERNAVPAAFTFDCHPSARLSGRSVPLLTSVEDREFLMRSQYGMEEILVASFDEMMNMPWEEFITGYLAKEQGAVHVVCGYDFRFGWRGEGNPERLKAKCAELGIGCDVIGAIELDGVRVSSTYIRSLIEQGEMERAAAFLGHPHILSDLVTPGKHLGRTLGFPTVNLHFQPGVIVPAYGVYAAKVYLEDGSEQIAVVNVGVRPTVEEVSQPNVEAFLLDFDGDLYGRRVRVAFYRHLRGERKFPSVEALTREVLRNAEETRAYWETEGGDKILQA